MTIVLIEPRRIRNWERVCFLVSCEPMIAAWLLPSPGKSEQIGETMIVARVGLMISLLFILILSIVCFGRIVLDLTEWIRVDVAKSPVRSGRSGFWIGRFRDVIPKNPAKMKMRIAFILDSFSV